MEIRMRSVLAFATALACAGIRASTFGDSVKVRLLMIRHGFSCANVMDSCTMDPEKAAEAAKKTWSQLNAALQSKYPEAHLNEDFGENGIKPAELKDCTMKVVDPDRNLVPDVEAWNGEVIRVHDVYSDPVLTDCSLYQSIQAGSALLDHLAKHKVRVNGVYSSMLLRAMETAYSMVLGGHHSKSLKNKVLTMTAQKHGVVAVPFMLETYPNSSVQMDNTPYDPDTQSKTLHKRYGKGTVADINLYRAWSGQMFNWEKFKAFLSLVLLPRAMGGSHVSPEQVEELRFHMESWDGGKNVTLEWPGARRTHIEADHFKPEDWLQSDAKEIVLILAGHSGVMSEVCEMSTPNNNEVYERQFMFTRSADGKHTLSEQHGSCHQILSAPKIQGLFREIAHPRDVLSCNTPYDVSEFLDFTDADNATRVHRGVTTTRCMRMALDVDSYKVTPLLN